MGWIKEVLVDIGATILIALAVFTGLPTLTWIVWGYTLILLIGKFVAYFGDNFLNLMDKSKTNAPEWFTHLLYALNTGLLLIFEWWFAGAGWAIIWLLSYLTQRKLNLRKNKR